MKNGKGTLTLTVAVSVRVTVAEVGPFGGALSVDPMDT